METRQTATQTTDFDLGACYMLATGRQPAIFLQPGDALTTVEMVNDEATHKLMMEYAAGSLMVNVKRFAACRAWIYRQARSLSDLKF